MANYFSICCTNCGETQNFNVHEQSCYKCGHSEENFPLKIKENITIPEMVNAANRTQKWVVEQHSGHLEYFEDEATAQHYADNCVYACYPPRLA